MRAFEFSPTRVRTSSKYLNVFVQLSLVEAVLSAFSFPFDFVLTSVFLPLRPGYDRLQIVWERLQRMHLPAMMSKMQYTPRLTGALFFPPFSASPWERSLHFLQRTG